MLVRITVFIAILAVSAFSQTRDTASIFGSVVDAQGAAVPGALVTVVHSSTGQARSASSDDAGRYNFNLLPVGGYQLSVQQPAFRRYERRGILLQANENVKIDVTLEVGDVKTTISVDAAGTQVETQLATLKETVDRARVVDLPLNGRDAAKLALLVPGVVSGGYTTGVSGQDSFSFNGSRNNNNVRFTLDGGQNMDNHYNMNVPFPFPDAVQEFSVQTSNMTVDHGGNSAGAINIVTKAGTNEVHGDAFWFVRNSNFNATNFFSHGPDNLKRNQAGFTLGGPVKKNKLFAFGGFQQLWIRSAPGSLRAQTLTAAERQGDFSATPIVIRDPTTGQPYPGNRIPQSQLSPAAQKLLTVVPLPGPDGFYNYSISLPENGRQYIGRVDYLLSDRHTLLVRGFRNEQTNPFHSQPDNMITSRRGSETPSTSGTVAHNFTVSPTMIAHTQISATHMIERGTTDFPKGYRDFGVDVYTPGSDVTIGMTSSGVSFSTPYQRLFKRASQEIIHDWTWTKGAHTLAWGVQYSWGQYNEATLWHASGGFAFDGHVTGFDRADFMIGRFSSFDQNNGEYENRRQFMQGYYFGDTWRVSRRLTLNLGLRYEPVTFMSDTMNRNQTFDLGNYQAGIKSEVFLNAPAGLLYYGDKAPKGYPCGPNIPLQVTCPDKNNFAPRVGIAWDPFGDGKTSIRSGYAIFYDVPMTRIQNNSNDVSPFSYGVQFYDGLLDKPFLGRENLNRYPLTSFGPDSPYPSPLQMYVLDSKWVTTYTQNWNLTVERQVLKDTRLRVAYVGTKGSHLSGFYDQNAPVYNPNLSLAQNRATIDARRPIQGFENIYRFIHGLNSSYNSLQISVDKRFSRGISILGSYTWSKSLDVESVNDGIGGFAASYPFNFNLWRGPANMNVPQRFVTSFVWDVPAPARSSGALNYFLRDWKLSGIVTLQSGLPFTVFAVGDPLAGIPGDPADLIGSGNPVLDAGRSKGDKVLRYFDTSRFANPGPGRIGTLGRNALEGPGTANVDAALAKSLRIPYLGEAGRAELRLEGFNVFNRTNFNGPVTGLTNSKFGQLTSAGDPRILQMAIKVLF